MSPELIGILTVGIGLSGLMVGMFAWLRQDMGGRIDRLERCTNERFDRVDDRITALDRGQAELRERGGEARRVA